jgi:hypothetical protein
VPRREALAAGTDRRHPADDLVSGHQRQARVGELAVDDVQVGPTHPAGGDRDRDLEGSRARARQLPLDQRLPDALEHHGAHARDVTARRGRAPEPNQRRVRSQH